MSEKIELPKICHICDMGITFDEYKNSYSSRCTRCGFEHIIHKPPKISRYEMEREEEREEKLAIHVVNLSGNGSVFA